MSSSIKYELKKKRLEELQLASNSLIISYLKQVAQDANSPSIRDMQKVLRDIRKEQWELFGQ